MQIKHIRLSKSPPSCESLITAISIIDKILLNLENTHHSSQQNMNRLISTTLKDVAGFQFGSKIFVDKCHIFAHTQLAFACINLKPILAGHCLVISKKHVCRMKELTYEEMGEMWYLAQQVSNMLTIKYENDAESMTFVIQDGIYAGQTIDHVHIHIIPRKSGDYERNNDIYVDLEKDGKYVQPIKTIEDDQRSAQTFQEMTDEAVAYRSVFDKM